MKQVNKNKGLTLIELILVMVIAAALIIIGVGIYMSKRHTMMINQDAQLINQLKKTTHTMTLNQRNYAGITESDYVNNKVISKRYKYKGNLINSKRNKVKIQVGSGSWKNSHNDKISFTFKGYNHKGCVKLLGLVSSKFYSFDVNGNKIISKKANNIASSCQPKNNTLTFNMVKRLNTARLRQVDNSLKIKKRNQAKGVVVNNKSRYQYQNQRQISALNNKP